MTDRATEYLKRLTQQMDADDKDFANAIKREPIANKQTAPPAPSRVTARKTTPNDEQNRAAENLAFINGPINTDGS